MSENDPNSTTPGASSPSLLLQAQRSSAGFNEDLKSTSPPGSGYRPNKKETAITRTRQQLDTLFRTCNNHLMNDSAKRQIQRMQLEKLLEDHRLDMNLKTAEMLQDLDFIEDHNLKHLYNYNLATNRNNYEYVLLSKEEHEDRRNDAKIIALQSKIAKENSLAYVKKKVMNARIQKVFEAKFDSKEE